MKENFAKDLKAHYEALLTGGVFSDVEIVVNVNDKNIKKGSCSVSFIIKKDDVTRSYTTLYVIERNERANIMYINDNKKEVIFHNNSKNIDEGLQKVEKYIVTYIERCIKKVYGMKI